MKEDLPALERSFQAALKEAADLESLSNLRVRFLGKKGSVTTALRSISDIPAADRPRFGAEVNALRKKMEEQLDARKLDLEQAEESKAAASEVLDISLPGRQPAVGRLHPLTQTEARIVQIFTSLGFAVASGPDVETDYYNFEALNFPPEHPARDMQDTLFLENGLLLRTHTSPVQIRVMEKQPPPVRIIIPGRVYRHDSDVTHSPVFHQVEGLCVGPNITFAHLKGTLETFVHMMFGKEIGTRFRPSFFPFTEPSAEVDMACGSCHGKGCRVCKGTGWIEILGCGMVDPAVYESVGTRWMERGEGNPYDPEKISGFAFGMGIERIAMVSHGIGDIRLFYENDTRFLEQFQD